MFESFKTSILGVFLLSVLMFSNPSFAYISLPCAGDSLCTCTYGCEADNGDPLETTCGEGFDHPPASSLCESSQAISNEACETAAAEACAGNYVTVLTAATYQNMQQFGLEILEVIDPKGNSYVGRAATEYLNKRFPAKLAPVKK